MAGLGMMDSGRGPRPEVRKYPLIKEEGPLREEARYEYKLDQSSVILDIGAYQGKFAVGIFERYRPIIHCFEPITQYFQELRVNTRQTGAILHNYGVGARTELVQISVDGDQSSVVFGSEQYETVQIKSMSDIWAELGLSTVDLVKINIEGMEYDLLDHIVACGLHNSMRNLQIQFHQIPGYESRIATITETLQKTHRQTYYWRLLWENWELNTA